MELEGQAGQEGQEPEAAPQQPAIDPRQAIEIAAQQWGVTPDYLEGSVRLQDENRRVSEENKRRQRELEVQQIKLDALMQNSQRYQEPQPSYQDVDPITRQVLERLDNLNRRFDEDRQQREDQARREYEAKQTGEELHNHFESLMRSVPTQNQVDAQRFFGSMAELWPDGPPQGVSPEKAVHITAKYLGFQSNGFAPQNGYMAQRQAQIRDPRASIVIPGGSVSSMAPAQPQSDDGPQRSNETNEAYTQRLARVLAERGVRGLRDGTRVSSE